MTDYLKKFGKQVITNGYKIVPIRPRGNGEDEKKGKAPGTMVPYQLLSGWQDLDWSLKDVERSIQHGNGSCGIGVLTKFTPAADIDCHSPAIVDQIREFIINRLGPTIERVGYAPKTLLLFRTDEPFGKITSQGYLDDEDRPAKLEFLGSGQQFVALAQHPVTGQPYRWEDGVSIADREVSSLPRITRADAMAICAEFDRIAVAAGWGKTSDASRGNFRSDDPFIADQPKVTDLSHEALHQAILDCPNDDDYDTWIQVGMALFHQFEGGDVGLEWWLEWSDRSLKCDTANCIQKWESGTFDAEGMAPTTFRFILKHAAKAEKEKAEAVFDQCMKAIAGSQTKESLAEAAKLARGTNFPDLDRRELASQIQARYRDITKTSLPVSQALSMVRYAPTALPDMPEWMEGYVFVIAEEGFFNLRTGKTVPTRVFDAVYSREVLTSQERLSGKVVPENRPSDLALNLHRVPIVEDRRYAPDVGESIFAVNEVQYVNAYAERGLAPLPASVTATGRDAIDRLKRHIRHIITNERDAAIFTSYLAHIVQTKSRVGWAILLQGTQGDGKTFFAELLGAVLGGDNVNVIGGADLEEKYTGWAENSLIVFVEEVRLGGDNRYKVIDRVKPLVTNSVLSVRRMRRDIYKVANKASYILTSNFRDAVPVGDEDTRYFPIFSQWQSREQLLEFTTANPNYYRDLYNCLHEAGSIRRWLLGYTLHPEFDAKSRAPKSSSRAEMVEITTDHLLENLRDILTTGRDLDFCPQLVDSALINDRLDEGGAQPLIGTKMHLYMQKAGYSSLGIVKVDGKSRRFWSSTPMRFRKTGPDGVDVVSTEAVRAWLSDDL